MENNVTSLCPSIYYAIGHSVFIGVAIFGIILGILALITIPRLSLGVLPSVLLFILAITDLLILGFQVPQVVLLENNYEAFSDSDRGASKWYARSYARRLRLTLYLFEGWMIICLTLNRFIFVRWPYYDGKYMTSKCALISVVSLAIFTVVLEAPAFGKIVMSQMTGSPHNRTAVTTEHTMVSTVNFNITLPPTVETNFNNTIETTLASTAAAETPHLVSTLNTEITDKISTPAGESTSATDFRSTETITDGSTSEEPDITTGLPEYATDLNDLSTPENTADYGQNTTGMFPTNVTKTPEPASKSTRNTPTVAGVMFKHFLAIRDTYVEVLDRFVTTLAPIAIVIPFLAVMAVVLPGGHPRMRTLSHDVIMERSAVVIMLSGVTWYVVANLPYQIFSLVTWLAQTTFKCNSDVMFHVATITLTCAFKPLIYFIVCPHFRQSLGAICSSKTKPKESFGTPSFDRISSRVFSSQDLDISRDSRESRASRESRGSYGDLPVESTSL